MQREYLFRGKRRDNGEWAYGLIQYTSAGDYGRICGWMGDDGGETYNEVEIIPETLGISLNHIIDGDQIFEGDILLSSNNKLWVVVWEDFCFWVSNYKIIDDSPKKWAGNEKYPFGKYLQMCKRANQTISKYGNIHNNPELIKT